MQRVNTLIRNNIFRLTMLYSLLFIVAATTMYIVVYWLVTESLFRSVQRDINTEINRRLGPDVGYQLGLESSEYAYFIEEDGRKVGGNIDKIPDPEPTFEDRADFVGPKRPSTLDRTDTTDTLENEDLMLAADALLSVEEELALEDALDEVTSTTRPSTSANDLPELKKENVVDVAVDAKEVNSTPPQTTEAKGELIGKTITVDNTRFFLGRNIYNERQQQNAIMSALSIGLISLIAIGLLGGWIISSRSMRRIDVMTKTTKRIMAGNFDLRIPTSRAKDDIADLTNNLNAMLDRINDLMQGMRQVTNNVAHDLRTPLTRLRGNLENMALRGDDYSQKEAGKAIEEVDELLKTFNALLSISQLESGSVEHDFSVFDLGVLVQELGDFYDVMAEEKGQSFQIDTFTNCKVSGNRNLISQAIINLLDNAIKYTPTGGEISIDMQCRPSTVTLSVMDTGEGFDETYADKLTERFFRLEKHRATKNGNGLGLSLVNAVIRGHKGTLSFANRLKAKGDRSGFIATVTLPLFNPNNQNENQPHV